LALVPREDWWLSGCPHIRPENKTKKLRKFLPSLMLFSNSC
jgi:hypothetical protein